MKTRLCCKSGTLLFVFFISLAAPCTAEMPKGFAISRSVFAIDVKFRENFERGSFDFYNFEHKKKLYLLGKKNYDYSVARPNFPGAFTNGYAVGRKAYMEKKAYDLKKGDDEKDKKLNPTQLKKELFYKVNENLTEITQKRLAEAFGTSETSAKRWVAEVRQSKNE